MRFGKKKKNHPSCNVENGPPGENKPQCKETQEKPVLTLQVQGEGSLCEAHSIEMEEWGHTDRELNRMESAGLGG